jgi:hypothetical protein
MCKFDEMHHILNDKKNLICHIRSTLHERTRNRPIYPQEEVDWDIAASVLLPLGHSSTKTGFPVEPCIIFNKRSLKVRQPGDLCFPGGSMSPLLDQQLARLFSLPFASLGRWKFWSNWKQNRTREAKLMSIFWATSLRESFEEMRLNPCGVKFLGPLPPQSLVMFQRKIYPMVAWIERQKRFFPNWEVEKIVHIPIRDLLNPAYYGRYRLNMETNPGTISPDNQREFPCFRFCKDDSFEVLWGATFRITILFLKYVFDFDPPVFDKLPIVSGNLDQNYLTGQNQG